VSPEKTEKLALAQLNRHLDWPRVKRKYLKTHRECAVCGRKTKLDVHHITPFWLDRNLELEQTNLITLCGEHHTLVGHLMSTKSYNVNVVTDAAHWADRIRNRPKWKL